MKTCHSCQLATHGRARASRPASRWRLGGEIAGWILSGATLVLLPKCPACVAACVALFSGVGVSITGASHLRTALLISCIGALVYLAVLRLHLLVSSRRKSASVVTRQITSDSHPDPL